METQRVCVCGVSLGLSRLTTQSPGAERALSWLKSRGGIEQHSVTFYIIFTIMSVASINSSITFGSQTHAKCFHSSVVFRCLCLCAFCDIFSPPEVQGMRAECVSLSQMLPIKIWASTSVVLAACVDQSPWTTC